MHPLFHLIYKIYLPKKQQNYSTKRAFVYGQGCTVHRWHIVQSERSTAERCGLHPLFLIRYQRLSHWAMPFGICENLGKDAGKMILCIFFITKGFCLRARLHGIPFIFHTLPEIVALGNAIRNL